MSGNANESVAPTSSYLDQGENFDLRNDARHVVKEVAFAVNCAKLSEVLLVEESCCHINLTSLENNNYCIELTERGYRIVSEAHDKIDDEYIKSNPPYYETLNSLLENTSLKYREAFGKALIDKLNDINKE